MEALTAVAGACLALYDMAKALDRSIEIREILLLEKTGGRSGAVSALAARPGGGIVSEAIYIRSMAIRVAILTVSDGVSSGAREDEGGPACEETLRKSGLEHRVVSREVLPDEPKQVARAIRVRADAGEADLILLTGGHRRGAARPDAGGRAGGDRVRGPGARGEDALRDLARLLGRVPLAAGRRACARSRSIVALPGSPKGAADCLARDPRARSPRDRADTGRKGGASAPRFDRS